MTQNDDAREASDLELLLPWYAAGTLRRRDRLRVERALREDFDLARKLELVRDELAETIHFNETLGAPSPAAAERLMAAIDAEAQDRRKRAGAAGWLTGFFANLSPRTVAVAASFAVLALALQSAMLLEVFTTPHGGATAATDTDRSGRGSFAMIRFARQANAADITNFLQNYQATLVDGPTPGGIYRIRLAMTTIAKDQFGRLIARMRQERVVELAEPSE
jgi:anti-sigma-K factor RskA